MAKIKKDISKKNKLKKILLRVAAATLGLILILSAGLLFYIISYDGKIYPNLSVAGIALGGNTPESASSVLSESINPVSELTLIYEDQDYTIKTNDINLNYDFTNSADKVYRFTRTGSAYYDIKNRLLLLRKPQDLGLETSIDEEKLSKLVSVIAGQISVEPIDPSVSNVNGNIVVNKGNVGKEVDQEMLIRKIKESLSFNKNEQILIIVDDTGSTISDSEAEDFTLRAKKFLGKGISLKFEYTNIQIKETKILEALSPKGGYKESILLGIIESAKASVERSPQNPKFVFENGKVTEFQPALDGIKVNDSELKSLLTEKLTELEDSDTKNLVLDIPVVKTSPEVSTEKVNDFGIKELIGRGSSTYFHSIPSRVHNVALAASRINGILVKPGETFSFNQTLGDVSSFTGYQQAYVISGGKTILGDGGGVCQVSTTLFRAVLDAGLPITERQAHAYRVSYYEQDSSPGLDATVYSPSPDFKFTNNTPGYILIEALVNTKNYSLVFELYGTDDGRVSTISKPVVSNVSSPPEDLYQDDPTLPTGTIKQIDWKAWGAKVTFNYSVKRGGQEIYSKTFVSNYKPWQAIYLRGTGPAN